MTSDPSLNQEIGEVAPGTFKRKRRPRAAVACDSCRTRKVKCDGEFPCSSCVQHGFDCSYKERQPVIIYSRVDPVPPTYTPLPNPQFHPPLLPGLKPQVQVMQPTSPVSLDGGRISEPSVMPTPKGSSSQETDSAQPDRNPDGLGEINQHTEGAEFYGPNGTFHFLSRLRTQAGSQQQPSSQGPSPSKSTADNSVVNLLHSSDYSVTNTSDTVGLRRPSINASPEAWKRFPYARSPSGRPDSRVDGTVSEFETEIERECARLYFQNLHCIHPILDHASFISRCEGEVWANKDETTQSSPSTKVRTRNRFLALFNSVLAIGAITAGETSMLMWERTISFIDQAEQQEGTASGPATYPPIRAARLFFERSKVCLGDIFDSSSFETAQTLFLMAIFCQNALKPHSCYMYSGMAIRTAFAIGIPTSLHADSNQESLLWWALYSHEVEMCSSAGRQSFLKEPNQYRILLPRPSISGGPSLYLVNCMVDLARLVAEIVANANKPDDGSGTVERSSKAIELERYLVDWKSRIPPELNFDAASLEDSELITKQKIVLKLRFLNAKILIHRPFLISGTAEPSRTRFTDHIISCVEAARETVRFVHSTYLYRPYFRTWWYNCTYVLDASMVLLYVILSKTYPYPVEDIISNVEMSLEVFTSMKMVAVARRCSDITREVLNIAKKAHRDRQVPATDASVGMEPMVMHRERPILANLPVVSATENVPNMAPRGGPEDMGLHNQEDLYASLVDTNLVFNFLNYEDWNAWAAPGY